MRPLMDKLVTRGLQPLHNSCSVWRLYRDVYKWRPQLPRMCGMTLLLYTIIRCGGLVHSLGFSGNRLTWQLCVSHYEERETER